MATYLVVDDRDGTVVAELAGPSQVVRLLGRLARSGPGDPRLSVVRLDHQVGSLTDVTSAVSMRPLAPLMERPAKRRRDDADTRDARTRRKRSEAPAPPRPG